MEDHEIGELWRYLWNDYPIHTVSPYAAVNLIRKLVEERSNGNELPIEWACETFGIDPKDFPAHVTRAEASGTGGDRKIEPTESE